MSVSIHSQRSLEILLICRQLGRGSRSVGVVPTGDRRGEKVEPSVAAGYLAARRLSSDLLAHDHLAGRLASPYDSPGFSARVSGGFFNGKPSRFQLLLLLLVICVTVDIVVHKRNAVAACAHSEWYMYVDPAGEDKIWVDEDISDHNTTYPHSSSGHHPHRCQ